jgi:hypothetical protein
LPTTDRVQWATIDVLEAEASDLGESDARVEEDQDDRGVTPLIEAGAGRGLEERVELLLAENGRGSLRDGRRLHPGHRGLADLTLVDEPPEDCCNER